MLQPNVNRSRSRGDVTLRSADPLDHPNIAMNLFSDRHDLDTLMAGAKLALPRHAEAFAPMSWMSTAGADACKVTTSGRRSSAKTPAASRTRAARANGH
ncbi:GMC oxidoreductase [Sinorhizobium americanum]|uniref:GMC oxidoreductase n=1 Tax=Sinorhizobium americanum TaxID=194963 RepID=UPI00093544D0